MERNWDTIREILLKVEAAGSRGGPSLNDFEDERHAEISYHVEIMEEAGLLDAMLSKTIGSEPTFFHIHRLTWSGNEFLDAIKDENVWQKTKDVVQKTGGSAGMDIV